MRRTAFCCLVSIMLFCTLSVQSDSIRGEVVATIIAGQTESTEARFLLGQYVSVECGEPEELLQGIEIEIGVPPEIRAFRDSFALYIYHTIDRKPQKGETAFSGSQALFEVVPPLPKFFVRIPLHEGVSFPSSADTLSSKRTLNYENFPLLLSVLPVMKGIPSKLLESELTVRVRPVFENKGILKLSISPANIQPIVSIDGQSVSYPAPHYALSTGIHQVSAVAPGFKAKSLSFGVEQGKHTELALELERATSFIQIEAPDNALIYIDGEKMPYPDRERFELQEGEHVVLFKLGDYRLSKRVQINPGRTYKISLFLDILVQED